MTERAKRSRAATATSNFGVGRRENHDATEFYARFPLPVVSDDDTLVAPYELEDDGCFEGDARAMDRIVDGSAALVVTSPPYFAGKAYEEALGEGHIPANYIEYLTLLHDVFAECVRKLEPGGRIAVNVANLGRKPYRSLSADVTRILEDLGLLHRGEVIWKKADGAGGNCAWGSFGSPANPVLRDVTERVVIASKGRFNRAKPAAERERLGLPFETTMTVDTFLAATLDVWDIPPEMANRVGHPAPFPVELPERLIDLYTYKGDLVIDPFMGSGSTLVAARRLGRRSAGYDMEAEYVALARRRMRSAVTVPGDHPVTTEAVLEGGDDFQARAVLEGKAAQGIAEHLLRDAGFHITHKNRKVPNTGASVNFVAQDAMGVDWYFDVTGAFTSTPGGLLRTDTVWKCLGRASVLRRKGVRVVFLTSHLPKRRSEGDAALRAAGTSAFFDAIAMLDDDHRARVRAYASGEHDAPLPGFWTEADLAGP